MKIAVTSTLPSFDALVGDKLHQSKYLSIVDLRTMDYKIMTNPMMMVSGPAMWKMFTQELLQEGVRIILSGDCNSNVSKSLGRAGIQVITGMSGSVRSAVRKFKEMCMADTIVMPIGNVQE